MRWVKQPGRGGGGSRRTLAGMPESGAGITRDEVAHLARLARLAVTDGGAGRLRRPARRDPGLGRARPGGRGRRRPADVARGAADQRAAPRPGHPVPGPGRGARGRAGRRGRPVPGAAHPRARKHEQRADPAQLPRTWPPPIAAGETSAVEATRAHLDRIAAVDDRVHAFLHVDAEGALAAARAVDADAGQPRRARWPASRSRSRTSSSPAACRPRADRKILEGWVPPYDATITARAAGPPAW